MALNVGRVPMCHTPFESRSLPIWRHRSEMFQICICLGTLNKVEKTELRLAYGVKNWLSFWLKGDFK